MTTTQHIVKLSTPADVIGAIPSIVGFHPTESLVIVCLQGERKRQDLTMRYDLPRPEDEQVIASDIAERALARDAVAAVLACFTDEPDDADGHLPGESLVWDTVAELTRRGIGYVQILLVRGGRWWSYDPDEASPVVGTPVPDESTGGAAEFEALKALSGRVVLADRQTLEQSVKGPVALREIALDQRYQEAVREYATELEACGREAARATTLDLADHLLWRFESGDADLDDAQACRVLAGFTDVIARDAVISWGIDNEGRLPLIALLTALAQRSLDDDAAPICSVLAAVAFLDGNGALGNVAVERALRSDPAYSLAQLVSMALQALIDPKHFRRAWSGVYDDYARPAREDGGAAA
jgi:hypothetical protein